MNGMPDLICRCVDRFTVIYAESLIWLHVWIQYLNFDIAIGTIRIDTQRITLEHELLCQYFARAVVFISGSAGRPLRDQRMEFALCFA